MVAIFGCIADYSGTLISNIMLGSGFKQTGLVIGGVVSPINSLCLFFCALISGSSTFLKNKYLSHGETEKARRIFGTSLVTIVVAGLSLSVLLYFFRMDYLRFFSLSNVAISYSYTYLGYYAMVPFFTMVSYFLYENIFKDGDQSFCSFLIVLQIVSMCLGVIVFTRFFQINGIALANALMEFNSFIASVLYYCKYKNKFMFKFGLSFKEVIEVLELGFMYCQAALYVAVYQTVILIFVGKQFGEGCMAIVVVLETITTVLSIFCGVPYSADNHMAFYLGEENPESLRKLVQSSLVLQTILAIITTVLVFAFAENIVVYIGIDALLIGEACFAVRTYALSFIFYALIQYNMDYYSFCNYYSASVILPFCTFILFDLGFSSWLATVVGERGLYIGVAISAPLALICTYIFTCIKYKTFNPYIFKFNNENIVSYDFFLNEDNIAKYKDCVEAELLKRSVSSSLVYKILLSFEESFMLTIGNNTKKKIYCECVLFFKEDEIKMILRDTGKLKASDQDEMPSSLRSYVVSRMYTTYHNHEYLDAAGSNRHCFDFTF